MIALVLYALQRPISACRELTTLSEPDDCRPVSRGV